MIYKNGSYKEPVWGDEHGVITCYMCKTDFDHELRENVRGVKAYPSEETLRESKPCVTECGVVKVGVRQVDESPTALFLEHIAFDYELGGSKSGVAIYPSKKSVQNNECYAFKYGVISVEVFLQEEIASPNFE